MKLWESHVQVAKKVMAFLDFEKIKISARGRFLKMPKMFFPAGQ